MIKAKEDKLGRLDAYNFTTSSQQIAQYPLLRRDSSKLLIRQSTQLFEDHCFSNIPKLLPKRSLIVLNDTKVFSCRLFGKKDTGAVVEVFLLEKPCFIINKKFYAKTNYLFYFKNLTKITSYKNKYKLLISTGSKKFSIPLKNFFSKNSVTTFWKY